MRRDKIETPVVHFFFDEFEYNGYYHDIHVWVNTMVDDIGVELKNPNYVVVPENYNNWTILRYDEDGDKFLDISEEEETKVLNKLWQEELDEKIID